MKKVVLVSVTVALIALLASVAMAHSALPETVWYSAGALQTSIGDQMNSGYDVVNLHGIGSPDNLQAITLIANVPQIVTINTLDFGVGLNSYTGGTYSFDMIRDLTVNGQTQSIDNLMTDEISYSDTLTVAGGNQYQFGNVKVTLLSCDPLSNPGGTMSEDVKAQFEVVPSSVPEPGAFLAALSILGPAGFVFRRRRLA